MKKLFLLFAFHLLILVTHAQSVQLLSSGTKASLRGLSVPDDQTVWVSGSNGTVGRSVDGGLNWVFTQVNGYEKTDFRDIEAFDANTAIIMGIDSPAYILKTLDGGKTWKKAYENHSRGIFLDAMDFEPNGRGMAIGDPIEGRFVMLCTRDSGSSWSKVDSKKSPQALQGEACFASSGSNIVSREPGGEMIIISGGNSSHIHFKKEKKPIPLLQGKPSTGANSIAIKNSKTFMIVGGDFEKKDSAAGNCVFTKNSGQSWKTPKIPPRGYRSSVAYLGKRNWITCGLNGVDITRNDGKKFLPVSTTGFHVCKKAAKGNTVYLAGGGGRIGKYLPSD